MLSLTRQAEGTADNGEQLTLGIVGAIAGVLSGGLTLVAGRVGGAVLGGVLGSFFHEGLGISKDDLARISSELDGGREP